MTTFFSLLLNYCLVYADPAKCLSVRISSIYITTVSMFFTLTTI